VPVPPTKSEDTYKGLIACSDDVVISYGSITGDF
jgi:hypothetical protein